MSDKQNKTPYSGMPSIPFIVFIGVYLGSGLILQAKVLKWHSINFLHP
jgi:hypothetical protein